MRALAATTEASADQGTLALSKPVNLAFSQLGEPAVAAMIEGIGSEQLPVKVAAADVLREMGPRAAKAVPALAKIVGDRNRWVRSFACNALGNVGPGAAPAVDALLAVVQHEDPYTRRHAVMALGQIGPAAVKAVPALKERANDTAEKDDVHDAAIAALYQVNLAQIERDALKKASKEIRELSQRLRSNDQFEAVPAAKTLARKGSEARLAVPSLALACNARTNGFAKRRPGRWARWAARPRWSGRRWNRPLPIRSRKFARRRKRPWRRSASSRTGDDRRGRCTGPQASAPPPRPGSPAASAGSGDAEPGDLPQAGRAARISGGRHRDVLRQHAAGGRHAAFSRPLARQQGKRVAIPYCRQGRIELFGWEGMDELELSKFGVLEPKPELCRLRNWALNPLKSTWWWRRAWRSTRRADASDTAKVITTGCCKRIRRGRPSSPWPSRVRSSRRFPCCPTTWPCTR